MLIWKHAIPAMIKKSVNRKTKLHRRKGKVISSYKQPYSNILEVLVLLEDFLDSPILITVLPPLILLEVNNKRE